MRLDKRWKPEPTREFLVELRDFALTSDCEAFFSEEEAFYRASASRLESVVASQEILPWLGEFFSTQQGASFEVIVGLLNGGANYGVGCAFPNGKEHITPVIGANAWGPEGLPLEIYCFTNTTVWTEYEDIQADIFDHLLAVVSEFGLRLYQKPAGSDLAGLGTNRDLAL